LLDPNTPIVNLSSRLSSNSYSISYDNNNTISLTVGSNTYSSTVTNTKDPINIQDFSTPPNTLAIVKLNNGLPLSSTEVRVNTLDISVYKQSPDVNGEIKGLLLARDYVIDYLDELNKLASELATAINEIIKQGYGYGDSPQEFFVPSSNIMASNISVNQKLKENPMLIGAASLSSLIDGVLGKATEIKGLDPNTQYKITVTNDNKLQLYKWNGSTWIEVGEAKDWPQPQDPSPDPITLGNTTAGKEEFIKITPAQTVSLSGDYPLAWPPSGDASNALAIAQLQSTVIDGLGSTFDDYYKNFIAKLGVDAHEAERMTTNQGVLVAQLTNRRESISGVSIDEEMAYMIQFLRGYEAVARLMTTLDEMLDVLINRMAVH